MPYFISQVWQQMTNAPTKEALAALIHHHIVQNRFDILDDGTVIIDAAGLELTLSEALAANSSSKEEAVFCPFCDEKEMCHDCQEYWHRKEGRK